MGMTSLIVNKLKKLREDRERNLDFTEDVDDKRLISLRRMRQKQLNEMEKHRLIKTIRKYNNDKFKRDMGIKKKYNKRALWSKYNTKNCLINEKKPIMKVKNIFKK